MAEFLDTVAEKVKGLFAPEEEPAIQADQLKSLVGEDAQIDNMKTMASETSQVDRIKNLAETSSFQDWLYGVNISIANILDIPEETYDISQNGKTGGRFFRKQFTELGFAPDEGNEPNSAAFSGGRMFGNTLPMIAAAPLAAGMKVAPLLGPVATIGRNILKSIGETAVRSPILTTAFETASATSSGVVGHIAKERFPDSPAVESLGYILGGFAPAAPMMAGRAVVTMLRKTPVAGTIMRFNANVAQQARELVTVSGAKKRAIHRVKLATEDAGTAIKNIESPDTLPEAKLTQAQKSGDPLLLSLEKSVIESSDELSLTHDKQIQELNSVIHESLRGTGGSPDATRATYEEGRNYLLKLLDGRMRIAALRADKRIAALSSKASVEEANLIAGAELSQAKAAARGQERELHNAVPDDIVSGLVSARKTLLEEMLNRGRTSDPEDIPEYITTFLGKLTKKGNMSKGSLKGTATVGEVRTLRSRILRTIREEEAKPGHNRNKVRILEDIQDSLLADLGAQRDNVKGEAGDALRRALDFSYALNDRFTRGPVGKLFGKAKGGGMKVAPELTLESTINIRGPNAAVNARALIKSVKDNPEELTGAVEDFIKGKFIKFAVRNGTINQTRAESYLRENVALLKEFPSIKADIENAVSSENARLLAGRRVQQISTRIGKPNISKASIFIGRGPDKAMEAVQQSKKPGLEIQNLINMAKRDSSGEATEGLQSAFLDWVVRKATVNSMDISGSNFISGAKMNRILADPATDIMASRLLTDVQRERLQQTLNTALKLDKILAAKPSKEGIIHDVPNAFLSIAGRISGAQSGRWIAKVLGGGTVQTPGIISGQVQKMLEHGVKDPARRLIIDAITSADDDLMLALLRKLESPESAEFMKQRLNAWVASVIFELGGQNAETENQPIGP